MPKITEITRENKNKPMRSDVGFEGLFRFYIDEGGIQTEEIEFHTHHASTYYYDDGWISEVVDEAKTYFFHDTLEFLDGMLEFDTNFAPRRLMDDSGEVLISIVGFFEEKVETDGDWETGYYESMTFIPKIAGYTVITEKDKEKIYESFLRDNRDYSEEDIDESLSMLEMIVETKDLRVKEEAIYYRTILMLQDLKNIHKIS